MNKKILYALGLLVSAGMLVLALTVLGNTQLLAPVVIVAAVYLFLGCLIRLCRMNEKLKNTVICAVDLLFWLP